MSIHELDRGLKEHQGTRLYLEVLKTCWIIHCLQNHAALRTGAAGMQLVVCLIVKVRELFVFGFEREIPPADYV
jgi:hypothetical protein